MIDAQEIAIKAVGPGHKTISIVGVPVTFSIGDTPHRFVLQKLNNENNREALVHYASGKAIGSTNNLIAFVGPSGMCWPLCRYDRAGLLVNKVARSYDPEILARLLDKSEVLNK